MNIDDKEHRGDRAMPVEETDASGGREPIGTAGLAGTSRRLSREMAERRRAEAAVRTSEARLRAIVNAVPDVLCVLDEDGRYVEILTSQPQLLYAAPESLRGRLLSEVLPVDLAGRLLQTIRRTLATRQPQMVEYDLYISAVGPRRFEGRTAPIEASETGKPAVVILARDITERKATEEQLRQAQKMEAIGQLTGGIAHDFNNLLAIVQGNLELLDEDLTSQPALRDLVQRALQSVERGATLTQRLLAFARRQPLQPEPVELNTLVVGMTGLLQRALGAAIQLETRLADELWRTVIDLAQFENALLNLALNARDAMPEGGRLQLETHNIRLGEDFASWRPYRVKPGDYVMLRLSDSGIGMAPGVLERVFEPFFTTKPVGKGSGLGLSMVYGLVKQSEGYIDIDSAPGCGTTVTVYLPRAEIDSDSNEVGLARDLPRASQATTVLVVEDDAEVRRLTVAMLNNLGYPTLEAGSARMALQVLADSAHISLLFTDVVLNCGMSGIELAREARRLRPDIKVLFTSAYPEAILVREGGLEETGDLLLKPYRKASLADKLRELLETSRSS